MNIVILKGNIAYKGELRKINATSGELSVLDISIATNLWYKKENITNFINVQLFGKQADLIDKFFSKGQGILVQGHLFLSSYEKDGVKKSVLKVIGDKVDFCGSAPKPKENNSTSIAVGEEVQLECSNCQKPEMFCECGIWEN